MADRLRELMDRNEVLYGVICRDPTFIDIELLGQVGYHVVWMDLEHGAISALDSEPVSTSGRTRRSTGSTGR